LSVHTLLEGSMVASVLRSYLAEAGQWEGTCQALLDTLTCRCPPSPGKTWPVTARAFSVHLKRLSPSLRKVGIDVIPDRKNVARLIKIVQFEIDGVKVDPGTSKQKNRTESVL